MVLMRKNYFVDDFGAAEFLDEFLRGGDDEVLFQRLGLQHCPLRHARPANKNTSRFLISPGMSKLGEKFSYTKF